MTDVTDVTEVTEEGQGGGKVGFLDALAGLFRRKEETVPPKPEPDRFGKLEVDFEAAVRSLRERIEQERRARAPAGAAPAAASAAPSADERAANTARRIRASHQAMREDIEKLHSQLGTGLAGGDLEALVGFLRELESEAGPGRRAQGLVPRARYSIAERLRLEAGELAVARLVALLQAQGRSWPDPTHYRPSASEEEIERSRRRRLGEVREAFLGQDFERTSDRLLGVVRGWGSDYPDRGSPLWEECALEGVAAGIRSQLLREFVEVLRRDRDVLLAEVETAVGKEIEGLQGVLEGGVRSVDEASRALAGSFRVLDEVAPEIAWEHVRSQLPSARGESGS